MVAERVAEVRRRIAAAARRAGRDPEEVTLVVVTKERSDDEVRAVCAAGVRDLGENRAAELVARIRAELPADVRWHFVGTLQRRKARLVAPHVHLLHSMDRIELARTWAAQDRVAPVVLQVNVARDPRKHGFAPEEAVAAAEAVAALGIEVRGLMTIPPRPRRPEDSRPWFEALRELRDAVAAAVPGATELSMGMTDDFEVAVECGATMVRVGRAIFVARGR